MHIDGLSYLRGIHVLRFHQFLGPVYSYMMLQVSNLQLVIVSKAGGEVEYSSPLIKRHMTSVLLFSSITGTVKTPDTIVPSGPIDVLC